MIHVRVATARPFGPCIRRRPFDQRCSRVVIDNILSRRYEDVMSNSGGRDDDLVTDLVIAVFRLNGMLLETGNSLVSELGLTTAWWQVLGALARSPTPIPVAYIARNMGLSRQAVQRVVDLLAARGMVRFALNPHHQRAKLVVMTAEGAIASKAADDRQRPLGQQLESSIGRERIGSALLVLGEVEAQLATMLDSIENLNRDGVTV